MSLRFEQRAQRSMVVDLAVEDDPAGAVFVRHRLMSAGSVDDRETPVPEHHTVAFVEPVAVGTSMGERRVHALDRRSRLRSELAIEREDAGDATHGVSPVRSMAPARANVASLAGDESKGGGDACRGYTSAL